MHTGHELMGSGKFEESYGYLGNYGLLVLDRILVAWDACDMAFAEVDEPTRKKMKGAIAHTMLTDVKSKEDKNMIHRALLGIGEMLSGIKEVCSKTAYLH